jgi:chitinase
MRPNLLAAILLKACFAGATLPAAAASSGLGESPYVVGYLASWSANAEIIAALPAERLTHIIYAFGQVTSSGLAAVEDQCRDVGICEGNAEPGGNFAALAKLKLLHPHLRVLIALGGWTGSQYFSEAAATPERRERLVRSAVDLFLGEHGNVFDGIDIDWEFPVEGGLAENSARAEDRVNLTALVLEFRRQLDALHWALGHRPILTVAATASPLLLKNLDVRALVQIVDWIGVMAYDYAAAGPKADFNAPLFPSVGTRARSESVHGSIQAYLNSGAPPSKLVLGVPFYGREYRNIAPGPNGDGLLQTSATQGGGSQDLPYRELTERDLEAQGFRNFWDETACVPWLYSLKDKAWISYDNPRSIAAKVTYAAIHRLRGVMAWELTGDDGRLLNAIHSSLTAVRGNSPQKGSPTAISTCRISGPHL